MNQARRALLTLAPAAALPRRAKAQASRTQPEWPTRPLRLVVSQAPGGGSDTLARVFAIGLGERIGQNVVVDNRTGAAGNIATEHVASTRPDGTTFLWGIDGPIVVNPSLFPNLRVDPQQALDPVCLLAQAPLILVVNANASWQTLPEMLADARARPNALAYGSAGNGTSGHLGGAMLAHRAGITVVHVPYRGAAPALNELISGQTQFIVTSVPSVAGLIAAGQGIRALAVTSARRIEGMPEVPTVSEAALPGFEAAIWYGIFAPKGTDRSIIDRMAEASAATVATPAIGQRLRSEGATPNDLRGEAFQVFLSTERAHWARLIRQVNLAID
jgi:tripartite-type tricarboxylate transporter receptor subunit TctC